MNLNISPKPKAIELLLLNLERIHDDIQFADQKATLFIVPNTGLLAFVWAEWKPSVTTTLLSVLAFIGMVFVVLAIASSIMVVIPRGRFYQSKRDKGIMDSVRIARYGIAREDDFKIAIQKCSEDEIISELQDLAFDYSQIHKIKYFFVEATVYLTALAFLLSFLTLLWMKYIPTVS